MQFAKLENDRLVRCPKTGKVDGKTHSNLPLFFEKHPDKALLNGWKPLTTQPVPDEPCRPVYTETDTQIVQGWEPVPEQTAIPTLEQDVEQLKVDVADLTDAVLDMSEQVYS